MLTMKAVEWHGADDVRVVERPRPRIEQSNDAIIRVTATTICGSDLHLYHNLVPGMEKGDVLGHEFMGYVQQVGENVKELQVGDRVVVSAVIACGSCFYCQQGCFSLCDTTNPSKEMEKMYGHRTAGLFGYSHLTGGYSGGQAEYARVPFADVNCLRVPDKLQDEQVLFLSDIVCTGWHACELGEVKFDDTVAVWGCGPVGLMAQKWAKYRGAKKVIAIDNVPNRLNFAKKIGCKIINFDHTDPVEALKELAPGGPDVCIEAAGFRFPKSISQKMQRTLKLETDAMDILNEQVMSCRKAGVISIVGDYFAYGNQFNIGALMEKGLTMRGSQVFIQKYWKDLLAKIENGEFDPTDVITHHMTLDEAPQAYRMFANMEDNALKIILRPTAGKIGVQEK